MINLTVVVGLLPYHNRHFLLEEGGELLNAIAPGSLMRVIVKKLKSKYNPG